MASYIEEEDEEEDKEKEKEKSFESTKSMKCCQDKS